MTRGTAFCRAASNDPVMTDGDLPLPDGWTEADYDSDRPDVRQAKQPLRFAPDAGGLWVHVRPDHPEHGEDWVVAIAEGDGAIEDATPVEEGIDDRRTALERARVLMEAVDHEGPHDSPTEVDWNRAMLAVEDEA